MSITRKTLRIEIGDDLHEGYSGTVPTSMPSGGDYFVDAAHIDPSESEQRWVGAWVIFTSGANDGVERRITAYDPTSGKFTLARAVAGGETPTYELHSLMSAKDMNTAINRALARCPYETEVQITPVAGQLQYPLAAYTLITDEGQVRRVFWREGATSYKYSYTNIPFRVESVAGVLTLHIDPYAFGMGASAKIILTYKAPYASLDTDVATTLCPPSWVKAGAKLIMHDMLIQQGSAQDTSKLERRRTEAAAEFGYQSACYAPRMILRKQLGGCVEVYTP